MESDSPLYPTLGQFNFNLDKNSEESQQSAVAQKPSGLLGAVAQKLSELLGSLLARCRLDGGDASSLKLSAMRQKLSGFLDSLLVRCRLDDDAGGASSLLKLHLATPEHQVFLNCIIVHLKLNLQEMYQCG